MWGPVALARSMPSRRGSSSRRASRRTSSARPAQANNFRGETLPARRNGTDVWQRLAAPDVRRQAAPQGEDPAQGSASGSARRPPGGRSDETHPWPAPGSGVPGRAAECDLVQREARFFLCFKKSPSSTHFGDTGRGPQTLPIVLDPRAPSCHPVPWTARSRGWSRRGSGRRGGGGRGG